MNQLSLDLESFISGYVFNYGINDTIVDRGTTEARKTFLILFSSVDKVIVASSKVLGASDFSVSAEENSNGASLTIQLINNKYTKNYVPEGKNYIADGFALISAEPLPKEQIDDPDLKEEVQFPNLEKTWSVLLKGELEEKPYFSNGTKFVFYPSTINFGVVNGN